MPCRRACRALCSKRLSRLTGLDLVLHCMASEKQHLVIHVAIAFKHLTKREAQRIVKMAISEEPRFRMQIKDNAWVPCPHIIIDDHLREIDMSGENAGPWVDFFAEQIGAPLDCPGRPSWEVILIQVSELDSVLLFRFAHSIGDGISMFYILTRSLALVNEESPNESSDGIFALRGGQAPPDADEAGQGPQDAAGSGPRPREPQAGPHPPHSPRPDDGSRHVALAVCDDDPKETCSRDVANPSKTGTPAGSNWGSGTNSRCSTPLQEEDWVESMMLLGDGLSADEGVKFGSASLLDAGMINASVANLERQSRLKQEQIRDPTELEKNSPALAPRRRRMNPVVRCVLMCFVLLRLILLVPWALLKLACLRRDPPSMFCKPGTLSAHRWYSASEGMSLKRMKTLCRSIKRMRITVNDVMLTCAVLALRELILGAGEQPQKLKVIIPFSLRASNKGGKKRVTADNRVTGLFMEVDFREGDPIKQLKLVNKGMRRLKSAPDAFVNAFLLWAIAKLLPASWAAGIVRYFYNKASLLLSNLPLGDNRLDLAGNPVKAILPVTTLVGDGQLAFMVSSYAGTVRCSVTADRAILSQKQAKAVTQAFVRHFEQLFRACVLSEDAPDVGRGARGAEHTSCSAVVPFALTESSAAGGRSSKAASVAPGAPKQAWG